MQQPNVIQLSQYRKKEKRKRKRVNEGKTGSVFVRNGKLWVDFRYLGHRVRESSGLPANTDNKKGVRKQLDLIIANDITAADSGIGADTNQVIIIDHEGKIEELPLMPKREVADKILDRVVELLGKR